MPKSDTKRAYSVKIEHKLETGRKRKEFVQAS